MEHEQEKTTKRHERIAGAKYGKTFGGVYYQNLEHYQGPVRKHVQRDHKDKYSLADVGGGSGIVGCSLLRTILDSGFEGTLDVLDINPKQLEGVLAEAESLEIPSEFVNPQRHDLLSDPPSQYDVASMRKVLHYFDKLGNEAVIRRLPQYLTEGGIFVLGSLVGEDPTDSRFKEEILDGIEEYIASGSNFSRRCVLDKVQLRSLLEQAGLKCVGETEYAEAIPLKFFQEKFGLSDDCMKQLNAVETKRIQRTEEPNLYNWKTRVYTCKKER